MSLLGNLITQVAQSALDPNDGQRNPVNQTTNARQTTGLGDVLGSVLGNMQGGSTSGGQVGLDDILGSVLGSQRSGSSTAGAGGLGDVLGSVLGQSSGTRSSSGKGLLIAALMPLVLSWIQKNGGLSGALSKISGMGFEGKAQSWVSNQQSNDNLDPSDITRLFNQSDIDQVASQTGANENEVRQGIAELLPEVMNQLTPQGNLQNEGEANQEIAQILSQLSGQLSNFR